MKPITGQIFVTAPERDFSLDRVTTPTLDYRAQMVVAYRHYLDKNFSLALAIYRQVLADHPGDATALSGEAWSLYYLGDGNGAAADFRALLHANAADSWARKGLSLCEGNKDALSS